MIEVKITCDTGKTWSTNINATFESAIRYFLGKTFTDECFETGKETHHKVIKVELIK